MVSTTKNLILFGGSFNPPHKAHFAIAHAAVMAFDAPCALMPSGQPWQKPHVAPAEHRHAMLQLALHDDAAHWHNTHDYPLSINAMELERAQSSYTVDTLRILREQQPDTRFIWLIGSDQLSNFHTWRDWQGIMTLAHIAVAQRAGHESGAAQLSEPVFAQYYTQHHCAVTDAAWQNAASGWLIDFPAPRLRVSSTEIRQAIAQPSARYISQLASGVQAYISQHDLYK